MDFNEANNILKRIKREYKAFEDLGDLIQYCIELEGSKNSRLADLADLKIAKDRAVEAADQATANLKEVTEQLNQADESHKKRVLDLNRKWQDRKNELDAKLAEAEVKAAAMIKELDDRIAIKRADYAQVAKDVDEAKQKYEAAVAQYNEFKRNL
jgi:hypothetical protein